MTKYQLTGSKALDRGVTFKRDVTYKNDAGVAIDLTGFVARFYIQRKKNGSELLSVNSSSGSNVTLTPLIGKISISLPTTLVKTLPEGTFYYSLVLDGGASNTIRLLEGDIEII